MAQMTHMFSEWDTSSREHGQLQGWCGPFLQWAPRNTEEQRQQATCPEGRSSWFQSLRGLASIDSSCALCVPCVLGVYALPSRHWYLQPGMGVKIFLITSAQVQLTNQSEGTAGLALLGVNSVVARSWQGEGGVKRRWGVSRSWQGKKWVNGGKRRFRKPGAIYQSAFQYFQYFSITRTDTAVLVHPG